MPTSPVFTVVAQPVEIAPAIAISRMRRLFFNDLFIGFIFGSRTLPALQSILQSSYYPANRKNIEFLSLVAFECVKKVEY